MKYPSKPAIEYAKVLVERFDKEEEVEIAPHEAPLLNELFRYIFRRRGEIKANKIHRNSIMALALRDFVGGVRRDG